MRIVNVVLMAVLAAALLVLGVASPAYAKGGDGGNRAGAKACQKGGYQNLYTSDGRSFASQDECVEYSAQGGTFGSAPVLTFQQTCEQYGGTFIPPVYVNSLGYCELPGGGTVDQRTALAVACDAEAVALGYLSGELVGDFVVVDPEFGDLEPVTACRGVVYQPGVHCGGEVGALGGGRS